MWVTWVTNNFIYIHKLKKGGITMKKYEKPTASAVNVTSTEIIATSLKYTDEGADRNIEVLTNRNRGDWGNFWK